jgi:hypothetical protein
VGLFFALFCIYMLSRGFVESQIHFRGNSFVISASVLPPLKVVVAYLSGRNTCLATGTFFYYFLSMVADIVLRLGHSWIHDYAIFMLQNFNSVRILSTKK